MVGRILLVSVISVDGLQLEHHVDGQQTHSQSSLVQDSLTNQYETHGHPQLDDHAPYYAQEDDSWEHDYLFVQSSEVEDATESDFEDLHFEPIDPIVNVRLPTEIEAVVIKQYLLDVLKSIIRRLNVYMQVIADIIYKGVLFEKFEIEFRAFWGRANVCETKKIP